MSLTLGSEAIPLSLDENETIRVGNTRVTLESVVYCFEEGSSPEAIVEAFPALNLADVYFVLGYCLKHSREVELYLRDQRQAVEAIRNSDEVRLQLGGLRSRLLSRRQDNGR